METVDCIVYGKVCVLIGVSPKEPLVFLGLDSPLFQETCDSVSCIKDYLTQKDKAVYTIPRVVIDRLGYYICSSFRMENLRNYYSTAKSNSGWQKQQAKNCSNFVCKILEEEYGLPSKIFWEFYFKGNVGVDVLNTQTQRDILQVGSIGKYKFLLQLTAGRGIHRLPVEDKSRRKALIRLYDILHGYSYRTRLCKVFDEHSLYTSFYIPTSPQLLDQMKGPNYWRFWSLMNDTFQEVRDGVEPYNNRYGQYVLMSLLKDPKKGKIIGMKSTELKPQIQLVVDVVVGMELTGVPPTFTNLVARHEIWLQEMLLRKDAKSSLPLAEPWFGDLVFEDGSYMECVNTPVRLQYEGRIQQHCVAGYENFIKRGSCQIYSYYNPQNKLRITLEIDESPYEWKYTIQQTKGFANLSFESDIQKAYQNVEQGYKHSEYIDDYINIISWLKANKIGDR